MASLWCFSCLLSLAPSGTQKGPGRKTEWGRRVARRAVDCGKAYPSHACQQCVEFSSDRSLGSGLLAQGSEKLGLDGDAEAFEEQQPVWCQRQGNAPVTMHTPPLSFPSWIREQCMEGWGSSCPLCSIWGVVSWELSLRCLCCRILQVQDYSLHLWITGK